jgi:glycosyltransferase involved in cell wall biosynthesis
MKILEVVEACGAGVGRHVISLCRGLVADNHQVTVAYSPHRLDGAFKRFMAERREEIRFFPIEARREVSPASDLRSVVRLLRLIKREGPFDVIHGHSSKGGGLARLAGRLSGIPTVYTPNSLIMSSPEISRSKAAAYTLIERSLGRFATSKMVAVSEEERDFALKLGLVRRGHVALIRNSIEDRDFEGFHDQGTPEGLDRRPLTFGSTMRFSAQKAPGNLVEAFVRTAEAVPHVPMRLVIAGDGELFDEVREQAETSKWSENISLLGWRTDPIEILRELDVFVVSSMYEAGLSFSTMEAMAARLPIVSTRVFGTQKTLTSIPGNILVPIGDVESLARGMQQMATLAPPGFLRPALLEIGQANREYVRENFMQSAATQRTVELYSELCGIAPGVERSAPHRATVGQA